MAQQKKQEIRSLRRRLDIPQKEFWNRIGVTQSCGSKYESANSMPKPASILFDLIYGTEASALKKLTALRSYANKG